MLEKFHENLLGADPKNKQFALSDVHRRLYAAFEEGHRGYFLPSQESREDPEKFLSTFVVALYQTTIPTPETVSLVTARVVEKWSIEQIKTIVRRIFSIRKKLTRAEVEPLKQALQRLEFGSRVLHIAESPPRWVAYGYTSLDVTPSWMRCKLIV